MRISLAWLREWVEAGEDIAALSHALTMAGLEIEGVERAGPVITGIVVGEVRSVEKHPDAEKLRVCRVSNGRDELQIVCGAPNVRVGMRAPLATVGATLPDGTQIKAARLRGVESFGMLCSARELGLSEDAAGLMDLPAQLRPGQDLVAALDLDDSILEVNLTPNRGDCMSVVGVAREVAAARAVPLHAPAIESVPATLGDAVKVHLESGVGCPKFVGRVIRGVSVGARSPHWIAERLRRAGVRPISAVVDVTNYVMLELGQPMHAYDLALLTGAVSARFARPGEQLTLLDGRTVDLAPDILVIADERNVLGMAGIMGGERSGISDATADVFLEAAFFDPATVAGRARRFGLVTDASQRFERGVDSALQERAIERATQLLIDFAGGRAGPTVTTVSEAHLPKAAPIRLRHRRIEHVLGAQIGAAIVPELLRRIGMTVESLSDLQPPASSPEPRSVNWKVVAPPWRFDVRIEEDLIEEVARLYGFENIPEADAVIEQSMQPWTETRVRSERAADLLVDRGYQEAITNAFTDPTLQSLLLPGQSAFALSNPISAELAVMRLTSWSGLIQALRDNQRRQQTRVRLFEVGRRYSATGEEADIIGGVASGPLVPEQWDGPARNVDFFDVKADVEALLALGGAAEYSFVAQHHPALHPGQSARIMRADAPAGWIGRLHPEHQKRLDLTYPVVMFEVETAIALTAVVPEFREISRYPSIRRDIAVIVDESVSAGAVRFAVQVAAGKLLRDLTTLSVYRGQQFEKGKKSIALGLQLQDTSRTLTDHEADAIVARVVDHLGRHLGGTLRDE